MKGFAEFTAVNGGGCVFVRPEHVQAIYEDGDFVIVVTDGTDFMVREKVDDVVAGLEAASLDVPDCEPEY